MHFSQGGWEAGINGLINFKGFDQEEVINKYK
jgi:hypothetical protein